MANISRSRKSGFTLRGGVLRRQSIWFGIPPTASTIAAADTAVIIVSLNAAALALRPFTVVRTRGLLYSRSDQTAADETYGTSLGVAAVSDQAVAIGVTAVPTPVADQGFGLFFVYESTTGRFSVTGATSFQSTWQNYDSRAMRKVESGQDVVFVLETWTGFAGTVVNHIARMLIKLH